ncbi:NUDIX hydrolase [Sinomonas sp. JGH33]|uniref:NUDIX hydrolase n=1 Tax=Sinomonas terricola TaxID=3110330 RepID=A0ABU5T1J6_9MICC|nr:NUDIX hydrolase [Sinomonas sp. JGH33]MEA5453532.1 NUDIX hydrolase [Sinomonas sp. JGH33]
MTDQPGTAEPVDHTGEPVAVFAAGALPWRVRSGELEVLLIHRPRYDDWSWPKGKLDPGETMPECAAREVREEIGLDEPLGIPLPSTSYHVPVGLKVVHYWALKVSASAVVRPDGTEVDSIHWCGVDEAATLLSNQTDVLPLRWLAEAHRRGELDTRPLVLLRHAKAKPRGSWTKAEGDRTLAASGVRQAAAVGRLLAVWSPERVVTSPWRRCVDTVRPYIAAANGRIKVKLDERLTEASHKRKPDRAAAAVDRLFDKRRSAVLCSHRPVLPTLLASFVLRCEPGLEAELPTEDPFLAAGEMIVFHVPVEGPARVVAVEQIKPYDD